jgi:hypothetical protein
LTICSELDLCFVNSIRDPYGCDAKQGRRLRSTASAARRSFGMKAISAMPTTPIQFELLNRLIV